MRLRSLIAVAATVVCAPAAFCQSWGISQVASSPPPPPDQLYFFSDYGTSFIQGPDGRLYAAFTVAGNDSDTAYLFNMQAGAANFNVLNTSNATSAPPYYPLLAGADGNYYAVAASSGEVYQFTSSGVATDLGKDGGIGPLLQTSDGALYGVGVSTGGTSYIYKLVLPNSYSTLYTFPSGQQPSSLLVAADGNFYGTTKGGGTYSDGTIFRVTPAGVGTTIYSFSGTSDGKAPTSLMQASDGNFYGLTAGSVFQYQASGALVTLHTFNGYPPIGPLFEAGDKNLYGDTAYTNGTPEKVFRVTFAGAYSEPISAVPSATYPVSSLVQANDGNFYLSVAGTQYGGVGEIVPTSAVPPPVQISSSAGTASVTAGTPVTITWNAVNLPAGSTQPCFASGGWSGWYPVSGTAQVTPTESGVATYALTCNGVESNAVNVSVTSPQQKATSTALAVGAQPVVIGSSLTLTATVSPTSGSPVPTGTVSFYSGTTLVGSGALNGSGVATVVKQTSGLPAGTYPVYAVYGGDSDNANSRSTAANVILKNASNVLLYASGSVVQQGQSETLSTLVTGSNPTGTVTFSSGGQTIGSAAVSESGSATLSVAQVEVPIGIYAVIATYSGDAANVSSTSKPVSVQVKATPHVVLSAAPNPVQQGQTVTLAVSVSATQSGNPTPTGNVTLMSGGTVLANLSLNSSGTASLEAPTVNYGAGSYPLTATYQGDGNYAAGTSSTVTVTITP
jgi:uncharacterized repeat protein (TIGR03803 family)